MPKPELEGIKIYVVEKTKKLVFWHRLMNKGTDASNINDEEIPESE